MLIASSLTFHLFGKYYFLSSYFVEKIVLYTGTNSKIRRVPHSEGR